jgi:translocation and assembly module TamA
MAAGCAAAPPAPSPGCPPLADPAACALLSRDAPLAYQAVITGTLDGDLLALLERASRLVAEADRPPATRAGLDQRIAADRARLDEVMRSQGYYAARIEAAIDAAVTPLAVTLTVDPGPTYRLAALEVEAHGAAEAIPPLPQPGLTAFLDSPARAVTLLAAEQSLLRQFADAWRPLARITERRITVDHALHTLRVHFTVDPGPPVRFGEPRVEGLSRLDPAVVLRLVPWVAGEPYDERKVDQLRQRLARTQLFSTILITPAAHAEPFDEVPVTVTVVERPPRTVGFGASYSTVEGAGGELLGELRGVGGRNDTLRARLRANRYTQRGLLGFERGDLARPEQDLKIEGEGIRSNSKAFNELTGKAFTGLRRSLSPVWRLSTGVALEASRVEDNRQRGTSLLAGLPVALSRDDTDDWLEPTSGTRLMFRTTPYAGWFDRQINFLSSEARGSAYEALDPAGRVVLAGRVRVGSLFGASREDIPPNQRFYAGGDGSVRGYKYQKVGPLDDDNKPLGGRSLFEVHGEARLKVSRTVGLGPFIDGGTVFNQVYPSFDETVRWAGGIGLWYVTAIGPVRLDLAFPINGTSRISDAVEVYVGFGHAF